LLFLPTELISRNGRRLAATVAELAVESRQSDAFRTWLAASVVFANTLVDRIVSEAIDPIGAVAEPYALWAIERGAFVEPFRHAAVQMVDDIEPFERLKMHILNLGHTVLADDWMKRRGAPGETVRAALGDPATSQRLSSIYSEEVLPGFALRGMGDGARRYIEITLERFGNPYLEHRLADIAQNHPTKIKNRIVAFLDWARERDGNFSAPRLSAMLRTGQSGFA
jgi:tagaturonate reductase